MGVRGESGLGGMLVVREVCNGVLDILMWLVFFGSSVSEEFGL